MHLVAACTLLFSTCLTASAFADTTYTFTVTDPNSPGSLSFSLAPSTPYTTTPGFGDFEYTGISGSVDGTPETFTYVTVTPFSTPAPGDGLSIVIPNMLYFGGTFDPQFLSGMPDGSDPVITPGTFTGTVECSSTLRSPFVKATGMPATMAFFQVQFPYTSTCGDPLQLSVMGSTPGTPPSSVTPEPATLGLFATGALGIAGVIRRRVRM